MRAPNRWSASSRPEFSRVSALHRRDQRGVTTAAADARMLEEALAGPPHVPLCEVGDRQSVDRAEPLDGWFGRLDPFERR